MNLLVEILYFVSSAMLIPVITLLLGLFVWVLIVLGRFGAEFRDRRSSRQNSDEDNHLAPELLNLITGADSRAEATHAVETWFDVRQRHMEKGLGQTFLAARIAPMLGLMGTLIPLGPALTGLATGDIETLAANLVVAFSTTVVGLAVAVIMTWVSTVRQRWYDNDLAAEIRDCEGTILRMDLKESGDERKVA